jgi:hypothetical protein
MMKPPIGLRPKYIAVSSRIKEIHEAMLRYIDADYVIPDEWLLEYMELTAQMKEDSHDNM